METGSAGRAAESTCHNSIRPRRRKPLCIRLSSLRVSQQSLGILRLSRLPIVILSMPTALVIGASRGVGLGLVHELVAKGYDVIAAARKPDGLSLGEGVRLLQLDITNEESVRKAAAEVESLVSSDMRQRTGIATQSANFATMARLDKA